MPAERVSLSGSGDGGELSAAGADAGGVLGWGPPGMAASGH